MIKTSVYLQLNLKDKAEKNLTECITLPRNNTPCIISLADLYRRTGRVEKAISLLNVVFKVRSDIPETHKILGDIYFAGSNHWKAAEEYRKYLIHDQRDPVTKKRMSDALTIVADSNMKKGRYTTAMRQYVEAMSLLKENKRKHILTNKIADAAIAAGDTKTAITYFRITSDLQPGNSSLFNSIAETCTDNGLYEDAFHFYTLSLKTSPRDSMTYVKIADIYLNNYHRADLAAEWYNKAIDANEVSDGADTARKKLKALGY